MAIYNLFVQYLAFKTLPNCLIYGHILNCTTLQYTVLGSEASPPRSVVIGFDPGPRHTKVVQMVPVAPYLALEFSKYG